MVCDIAVAEARQLAWLRQSLQRRLRLSSESALEITDWVSALVVCFAVGLARFEAHCTSCPTPHLLVPLSSGCAQPEGMTKVSQRLTSQRPKAGERPASFRDAMDSSRATQAAVRSPQSATCRMILFTDGLCLGSHDPRICRSFCAAPSSRRTGEQTVASHRCKLSSGSPGMGPWNGRHE